MAPFQHGFIDLAQLVNFWYILKLTIKTDVVSKMLGDIWLIAYKIVVLYIALTHILETFFYRFATMKGVNPSRSNFFTSTRNCKLWRFAPHVRAKKELFVTVKMQLFLSLKNSSVRLSKTRPINALENIWTKFATTAKLVCVLGREVCSYCCLPLLPPLACSITATTHNYYFPAQ